MIALLTPIVIAIVIIWIFLQLLKREIERHLFGQYEEEDDYDHY